MCMVFISRHYIPSSRHFFTASASNVKPSLLMKLNSYELRGSSISNGVSLIHIFVGAWKGDMDGILIFVCPLLSSALFCLISLGRPDYSLLPWLGLSLRAIRHSSQTRRQRRTPCLRRYPVNLTALLNFL